MPGSKRSLEGDIIQSPYSSETTTDSDTDLPSTIELDRPSQTDNLPVNSSR